MQLTPRLRVLSQKKLTLHHHLLSQRMSSNKTAMETRELSRW